MRPGVLLVLANFFCLVRVLMALDLPALDLPQKAISIPTSLGHSFSLDALVWNCALLKSIMFCVQMRLT